MVLVASCFLFGSSQIRSARKWVLNVPCTHSQRIKHHLSDPFEAVDLSNGLSKAIPVSACDLLYSPQKPSGGGKQHEEQSPAVPPLQKIAAFAEWTGSGNVLPSRQHFSIYQLKSCEGHGLFPAAGLSALCPGFIRECIGARVDPRFCIRTFRPLQIKRSR